MQTNNNNDKLLSRLLQGDLSVEEMNHLKQDDSTEELIEIISAVDQFRAPAFDITKGLEQLKARINSEPSTEADQIPIDRKQGLRRKLFFGLSIAASLLFLLYILPFGPSSQQTFQAGIASNKHFDLPDESSIDLNAESQLSFDKKNWKQNRVLSLSGEAYIDVKKKGPFKVITSTGVVSVLGTKFNVYSRDNDLKVECYSGKVLVELPNGNSKELVAGQGVILKDEKLAFDSNIMDNQPSWVKGFSSFKSRPLSFVIRELERQYNYQVQLDDNEQSKLFTGVFVHKDIDKALRMICDPMGLTFEKSQKTINIYK